MSAGSNQAARRPLPPRRVELRAWHRARGLTLIELALGLAVILIVITIGLVMYREADRTAQQLRAVQGVIELQSAVKTLFARYPRYTGLTNTLLINARKAPASLLMDGTLKTGFGPVEVRGEILPGVFAIVLMVPDWACAPVIQSLAPSFTDVYVGTWVSASAVKSVGGALSSPTAINAVCQAEPSRAIHFWDRLR